MALHGHEMDESTSPLEAGLAWTVDTKTDRDFVGRAALGPPARSLVGLVLLDQGVLRAQQAVCTAHGDGVTTSGSFAPTLNRSIAFARVPVAVTAGDTVEVDVRGKGLRARVVTPPFVRDGKSLVDRFLI
jgi:aminomethyltransferase